MKRITDVFHKKKWHLKSFHFIGNPLSNEPLWQDPRKGSIFCFNGRVTVILGAFWRWMANSYGHEASIIPLKHWKLFPSKYDEVWSNLGWTNLRPQECGHIFSAFWQVSAIGSSKSFWPIARIAGNFQYRGNIWTPFYKLPISHE